jgi:hypothetical protein
MNMADADLDPMMVPLHPDLVAMAVVMMVMHPDEDPELNRGLRFGSSFGRRNGRSREQD